MEHSSAAMILAAGFGSRLGSVTKSTPKCLIDVGGKPMLQHVIERIKMTGIRTIVVNVHHLREQVEEFINSYHDHSISLHISREDTLLGTGGALVHASHLFRNFTSVLVHNADVYSDIPLVPVLKAHSENNALVSLVVMERETTRPLLFDDQGFLVGYENTEKQSGEIFGSRALARPLAFTGIQVIAPSVLSYFSMKTPFSSISGYLSAARDGQKVLAYETSGFYWIDMGRQEHLQELRVLVDESSMLQ